MKHLISNPRAVRGKIPTVQFRVTILDDDGEACWDLFGFRLDARRQLKFPRNRTMQGTYFDSCRASDRIVFEILTALEEHDEIQEYLGPKEKWKKKSDKKFKDKEVEEKL